MAAKIDLTDLPEDVRAQLGLVAPRNEKRTRRTMSKDEVRSHALRVCAVVASLSQRERKRVLQHALKVNEV